MKKGAERVEKKEGLGETGFCTKCGKSINPDRVRYIMEVRESHDPTKPMICIGCQEEMERTGESIKLTDSSARLQSGMAIGARPSHD